LEGDYAGLASALLSNVFSPRFLSPLEEADKTLALKIHHTGVHQYPFLPSPSLPLSKNDKHLMYIDMLKD
jgi:hypothetical protein